MLEVILKRFEQSDEVRTFAKGRFEVVRLGGMTIGRATTSRAGNGRCTWAGRRERRAVRWSTWGWRFPGGRRRQWMTGG
jgi:hypothetical protein